MSYGLILLVGSLFLTATPMTAWALHLGTPTAGHPETGIYRTEDVRNTLHNLGDSIANFDNPNIQPTAGNTNEVCVFCHTPHGASPSAPGSAPLWNREIPSTVYALYGSPNFDSIPGQPQGVSLACLSCHDGTISIDALINVGGSGGFQGFTPTSGDLVNPQGISALIDASGSMTEAPPDRTDTGANYEVITGSAQPFPNLGANLADDHPISMRIPNSNGGCAGFTGPTDDPQFDDLCTDSTTLGGNVLLLQRSGQGPSDRRDAIRAYPAPGGTVSTDTFVECASCHNPHAPRPLFLRLPSALDVGTNIGSNTAIPGVWDGDGTEKWGDNPNKGSAICITCHEK